jgi:hypothetical protein
MEGIKFEKLELEYPVNSNPKILFFFLNAPTGLTEWFCDDLNIDEKIFTFFWDNENRSAVLLDSKTNKYARFRWLDMPEDTYFEFKIQVEDITRQLSLFITDYEPIEDHDNSKLLWDSQVNKLFQCIGA